MKPNHFLHRLFLRRLVMPALLMTAAAGACRADVITLDSQGTAINPSQTNNATGVTIPIAKHPAWADPFAGSSWISYRTTGDPSAPGYYVVPNGTVYSYLDTFSLRGKPIDGVLSVMADDSVAVYLNGQLVAPEASQNGNTYRTCSDSAPGCLASTAEVLNLEPFLKVGKNTLTFDVAQRAGSSYGLDYAGSLNVSRTPEPASLALMGFGLMALGLVGRRRFVRQSR